MSYRFPPSMTPTRLTERRHDAPRIPEHRPWRFLERYDAVYRGLLVRAAQSCSNVVRVTDEQWTYDPNRPAYAYKEIADHIAARIAEGELTPSMRLPGERELAAQYGVALGTARRAVRELRDRGLVITLPAKGTYVKPGTVKTDDV